MKDSFIQPKIKKFVWKTYLRFKFFEYVID